MRERQRGIAGLAAFAVLGVISLNVSPPDLGCGGTEYSADGTECATAEFAMTIESARYARVERQMCLRALRAESGCALYEYNLVGLDEESHGMEEVAPEWLRIVHGEGCDETSFEATLVEPIDGKSMKIAMVGTPTRAPIFTDDTAEPLAFGTCTTDSWDGAEFELSIAWAAEDKPIK